MQSKIIDESVFNKTVLVEDENVDLLVTVDKEQQHYSIKYQTKDGAIIETIDLNKDDIDHIYKMLNTAKVQKCLK